MLTSLTAKPLGPAHADTVHQVLHQDPYANCLVASRFDEAGMHAPGLGGQLGGIAGGRSGLCYFGGTLTPLAGDPRATRAFPSTAGRQTRHSASIVGRAELVLPLWDMVRV